MGQIKPIETYYNGHRFRSRAEARWAVFFDNAGIEWMYEAEGYKLSDGTMYLPDFYLPDPDCFFEVKGVMTDVDQHKIDMLIHDADKPVTIGDANMRFIACDFLGNCHDDGERFYTCSTHSSALVKCGHCGRLYFMGSCGVYDCYHCECDYHSGHWCDYNIQIYGDPEDGHYGESYPMDHARRIALQARFEHGETPERKAYSTHRHTRSWFHPAAPSPATQEAGSSPPVVRSEVQDPDVFRPARSPWADEGSFRTGAPSRQAGGSAARPVSPAPDDGPPIPNEPPEQVVFRPVRDPWVTAASAAAEAQSYAPPVQRPAPRIPEPGQMGGTTPPTGARREPRDWLIDGDRGFWPDFAARVADKVNPMMRSVLIDPVRMGGIWCDGTLTIWVENEWARSLVNRPHNISAFRAVARDMFGIWPRVQIVVGQPPDPLPPPEQVEAGPQVPERDAMDDLLQFSGHNNIDII